MNEAKSDMEHGLHHMQQVITRPVRALESNLIYHHRRVREERRKERKLEKKEKMPLLSRFKKGKKSETTETEREAESFHNRQSKERERNKENRTRAVSHNPSPNRQEQDQNKSKSYSQSKQGISYNRNEPETVKEEPESLAARIYVEASEITLLEERLGKDFYLEKQEYLDGYMLVLESERLDEVTKALESQGPDLNGKLESYFASQDLADQREQQAGEYEYETQYSDSMSLSEPPLEPLPDYDLYQQAAAEMESEADRDRDIDIEPEPGRTESQVDFAELEKSLLHDLQLETELESDINPALSAQMEPSTSGLEETVEAMDVIETMNPVDSIDIDQELEKELDLIKELEFDLDDFF